MHIYLIFTATFVVGFAAHRNRPSGQLQTYAMLQQPCCLSIVVEAGRRNGYSINICLTISGGVCCAPQ